MNVEKYKYWFYAAAIYNLLWGTFNILFPRLYFRLIDVKAPELIPIWQAIGMFVLVYSPAYYWAGRNPDVYPQLILIGFIGKIFGPLGFFIAYINGDLPLNFVITNITNDLIWLPAFYLYLKEVINEIGLKNLITGEINSESNENINRPSK